MLISVILNLLMINIIIVVHELGHFIFAKISGMQVDEFAVGFGPKLFSIKKGDTTYALKLFLLGGSCSIAGMIDDEELMGTPITERSFVRKSFIKRFLTILGGPLFNIILAFILSLILIGNLGYVKGEIHSVEPNSAASGLLQAGDTITKINGHSTPEARYINLYMTGNGDKPVNITFKRDNNIKTVQVTPKYSDNSNSYVLGIYFNSKPVKSKNPLEIIKYSSYGVLYYIKMTFMSLHLLITHKAGLNDFVGPVGMTKIVNRAVSESRSFGLVAVIFNMLGLTILISTNLGIINLLPFPALDGGRLLIMIIELIIRRKVPTKFEAYLNTAGFALLMLLSAVIIFNDFRHLL